MLWRVSPPLRSRLKPAGFILPCQPALADRPPSGPGWLHEIKFDGYRVIARKDGERVRLWARTTSDYSNTFTRIRDAVAALPVDSAVLDGEAVVFRSDTSSAFEALKSRHGQAEAVLVAYDIMEVDGQDVRPEPLEERRKRLAKRLSRRKVMPIFPPAKGTPGYRTEGLPPFETCARLKVLGRQSEYFSNLHCGK
jgi:bifunctional non-homologous end joining protein LigD